jgi:uncharacterized protein (TIRG00374 family)
MASVVGEPHGRGRFSAQRAVFRRIWPVLRYVFALGVVILAVWALSAHTDELSGVPETLENLNWWWVVPAVLAEAASFACFARMQYELLRCGGLEAPGLPLLKMTLASQALTNSLPAGNAVSAVYGFRWFRRFGADDTLAIWAMVGTLIAAMVSLSLVATAGLALAAGEGASLDLIPVLIGVLLITTAIGALFVFDRPLFVVLTWAMRTSQRIVRRPRGDLVAQVDRIMRRITSVHLAWRQVVTVVAWGTANWLLDCTCFALMFLAVDSTIPWKGLLLAYGAGQLAAALPITPGGLGAVEGSITIALVAFGGDHVTTVDAVLMYRLISFWLVLVVGWSLWGELAHEVRTGLNMAMVVEERSVPGS